MSLLSVLALLISASPEAARLNSQGVAAASSGRLSAALTSFEAAFKLDSSSAEIAYNLARAREAAGRIKDAIEAYEHYVILAPSAKDVSAVEQKIAQLRVSQIAVPDEAKEFALAGQRFVRAGQLREAELQFKFAAALAPEWPAIHFNLGTLYEAQGRSEEAAPHFRRYLPFASPAELSSLKGKLAVYDLRVAETRRKEEALATDSQRRTAVTAEEARRKEEAAVEEIRRKELAERDRQESNLKFDQQRSLQKGRSLMNITVQGDVAPELKFSVELVQGAAKSSCLSLVTGGERCSILALAGPARLTVSNSSGLLVDARDAPFPEDSFNLEISRSRRPKVISIVIGTSVGALGGLAVGLFAGSSLGRGFQPGDFDGDRNIIVSMAMPPNADQKAGHFLVGGVIGIAVGALVGLAVGWLVGKAFGDSYVIRPAPWLARVQFPTMAVPATERQPPTPIGAATGPTEHVGSPTAFPGADASRMTAPVAAQGEEQTCNQEPAAAESACLARCRQDPLGPPKGTTCDPWCAGRRTHYAECCRGLKSASGAESAKDCYF